MNNAGTQSPAGRKIPSATPTFSAPPPDEAEIVAALAEGELHGGWLRDRCQKSWRKTARLRAAAETDCWRLYDRDIPELPLTIDRYQDHLHVSVWSRGFEQQPVLREARLRMAMEILAMSLEIPEASVHWKERARQKGSEQYQPRLERNAPLLVQEGPVKLHVDLERYLDTGLFLDHRVARAKIRAEARDKHVLNVFAYTGAFSVHAAVGGAASTTSVDLSRTYCDWIVENLRANGVDDPRRQHVLPLDVRTFLDQAIERGDGWDLIVCDPPSFSNSKRTRSTFDIQRDHIGLIGRLRSVMRPGASLLFSTNFREFELDPRVFDGMFWSETSEQTVPPEFRDRKVHRSWWATAP